MRHEVEFFGVFGSLLPGPMTRERLFALMMNRAEIMYWKEYNALRHSMLMLSSYETPVELFRVSSFDSATAEDQHYRFNASRFNASGN